MATEAFKAGNELFVDEDFEGALAKYSEAISLCDTNPEFFVKRAAAHSKLSRTTDALMDVESALQLDSKNVKALLRKGQLLFDAKQHSDARRVFDEFAAHGGDAATAKSWIAKCDAALGGAPVQAQHTEKPAPMEDVQTPAGASLEPAVSATTGSATVVAAATPTPTPASAALKIKHDWYQTDSHVIVTVLIKNVRQEDLDFQIHGSNLTLEAKLHTGSNYSLDVDLWGDVVESECVCKAMSTKIEIKLKKTKAIRWAALEGAPGAQATGPAVVMEAAPKAAAASSDPSARFKKWDTLAKDITEEEKNEKPTGDEALNSLFKQIYGDANDDVKRAMIKSYQESAGTVLSTNWSEVGKGKVDVKPPSGMEYKKY